MQVSTLCYGFGLFVSLLFLGYGLWEWRPGRRKAKKP